MPPVDDQSGLLDSGQYEHSNDISGFPVDLGSSADWEFPFPLSESGQLDGQPGEKRPYGSKEHIFIDLKVSVHTSMQLSSFTEC